MKKMKNYVVVLALVSSVFSCAMDEPAKSYEKIDKAIESIRDRIDQDLGVNINGWGRSAFGFYASWSKASSLGEQAASDELKKIELYIPAGLPHQETYQRLAKRHSYVNYLITKHAAHEVAALKDVKGSNIDAMLNEQRVIPGLSKSMSAFIHQKAERDAQVFVRLGHRLADNKILFDEQDIQLIPLFASNRVNVNGGSLVTSTDSKYAKSTDINGNTIMWDLESGCSTTVVDNNIQWERRRSREEYDPYAVIDRADEHAIFTDVRHYSVLTSYPRYISFVKKDSHQDGYLMILFKRPTKESRLCREAFLNSRGNTEQLHQLLNSETLKKIKGFPATNLRFLIEEELDNLGRQQAKI